MKVALTGRLGAGVLESHVSKSARHGAPSFFFRTEFSAAERNPAAKTSDPLDGDGVEGGGGGGQDGGGIAAVKLDVFPVLAA